MCTYVREMSKADYIRLIADLLEGTPRIGYVNSGTGLKVSSFRNWDAWFGFGEWDDGPRSIYCLVTDDNVAADKWLREKGFKELL